MPVRSGVSISNRLGSFHDCERRRGTTIKSNSRGRIRPNRCTAEAVPQTHEIACEHRLADGCSPEQEAMHAGDERFDVPNRMSPMFRQRTPTLPRCATIWAPASLDSHRQSTRARMSSRQWAQRRSLDAGGEFRFFQLRTLISFKLWESPKPKEL